MMRRIGVTLLISVVILTLSTESPAEEAKSMDMTARLGFGANVTLNGAMGVSARYWITNLVAIEGVFNYTSTSRDDNDSSYFAIAGRGTYTLFDYGMVHGCVGGGLAFGTSQEEVNTETDKENFIGLEFFFQVETMVNEFFSVSGQTGLSYINGDNSSVFSIGTPGVVGMFGFHFYL